MSDVIWPNCVAYYCVSISRKSKYSITSIIRLINNSVSRSLVLRSRDQANESRLLVSHQRPHVILAPHQQIS